MEVPQLGQGIVIDCEGGYFAGEPRRRVFDTAGRKIKEFRDERKPQEWSTSHVATSWRLCAAARPPS